MSMSDAERFHPETIGQWRDWLAAHHTQREGVWLVLWRRESGQPVLDDAEAGIEHPVLTERLDADATARKAWDTLSPSRQKFHLTQIAMAKQEATKLSRVEAIVTQLGG
jgi:hypothetical protein